MRIRVGDLSVNCLLYADDAVLIASSECELHALVTTLKEQCENNSLSLNVSKIKILVFERNDERTEYNAMILEQMNEVVYLVSLFSRDGRYRIDAERRIVVGNRVNCALTALMRR